MNSKKLKAATCLLVFLLLGIAVLIGAGPALAGDEPFVGEIMIFAGDFAPKGWAMCNGQILPISQNTALFSLLGTTYGGNGKSTFALPDLQGRVPIQAGQGPGLSLRDLGETGGAETVTLLQSEMPLHIHGYYTSNAYAGNASSPGAGYSLAKAGDTVNRKEIKLYAAPAAAEPNLTIAGAGMPHNNMQPYQVLNYIIALQGIFPPRS
ncbi:MAG: tail fiber protein [Desulfotomaculaceae bacterium]|nr:tail fiber protein [Desulfotomaculaceae bacterium]